MIVYYEMALFAYETMRRSPRRLAGRQSRNFALPRDPVADPSHGSRRAGCSAGSAIGQLVGSGWLISARRARDTSDTLD